jgi:nondiscriminating glutamyl-tRNA synthetase
MNSRPLKTRFAPSPTGLLHLGNIRTALFSYLLGKRPGGAYVLRIEDTDAARGQEQYAVALMQDMRWLGLQWDEGPEIGGPHAPYYQSQRGTIYRQYAEQLTAAGLVYPCFCTEQELKVERKTQIAAGRPPRYSGKCRGLLPAQVAEHRARGVPATLRFHVADGRSVEFVDHVRGPQHFDTSDIGDFVIQRSDGTPAFFFCNAVDDALMGVTSVVRGDDHLSNTPRQILLLEALALPVPEYAHIPLVVGSDGAPLSKRTGSKSVQELRAAGFLPLAINNYLARVGHTYDSNQLLPLDRLVAQFALAHVHHSPARYDEAQLLHWQREALRTASSAALVEWIGDDVRARVPVAEREAFIDTVRANVVFPANAMRWACIVYGDELAPTDAACAAITDAAPGFFDHALAALTAHATDFRALSDAIKQATGQSGKNLFKPLRAALTGEIDGPEMARLLPLIGVERARRRFERARLRSVDKLRTNT